MLTNLLAATLSYEAYKYIQFALIAITALCAIFVTVVVLIQPGNSNGISAINGGTTDTFYGKNKGKTIVSKLKTLTVICLTIMAVLMVTYFLFELYLTKLIPG